MAFPGLGLEFHLNRVAFEPLGLPIYWYGVIIAAGFLLAVLFCYKMAPRFGVKSDDIIDLLFFAVPLAIVGARLYYIVFYLGPLPERRGSLDLGKMLDIRDGGLAIYGGVIAATLTLIVFCKVKSSIFCLCGCGRVRPSLASVWDGGAILSMWRHMAGPTDLPWRMGIDAYANGAWQYMEVHPHFFYESAWNLLGFLLLLVVVLREEKI